MKFAKRLDSEASRCWKSSYFNYKAVKQSIKQELQALGLGRVLYEDTGNIGKGYRRHDEVGTPICITVDFETIEENDKVTVRDRDTMEQVRIPTENVTTMLFDKLQA